MVQCGTITVQSPGDAAQVSCSTSPSNPLPNETITISVDIENTLNSEICVYLEILANGQLLTDLNGLCRTVPAGGTETETENFTASEVGASEGSNFNTEVNVTNVDVGPF